MQKDDLILVSVDDHIVEPPTVFDAHLSRAHRDLAPKYVLDADGRGSWLWEHEGRRNYYSGLNAVVGKPKSEYGMEPTELAQLRPAAWDIHRRIDDMNVNGLLGSLCFGSFVHYDGSYFLTAKDKANAVRVLRAYNDWHIDEWCGTYPGRFIPLAILPLWDMDETLAEVKRVHKKGCWAISLPENPAIKGLPSIHNSFWEPLWQLCNEIGLVICCHIGTGRPHPHASDESPVSAWITGMPMSIFHAAADWLHLKALQRYPRLKIALSEGGIGWLPYFLERAAFTQFQHGAWTNFDFGGKTPTELFQEHFIACFIDDIFGCQNLDKIGVDNICYESDYPHSDSLWPVAPEAVFENFKGLDDSTIDKITHLNAMRHFHYDPFSILGRKNCTVGSLRAQAKHVDTTPVSQMTEDQRWTKMVTSGDVGELLVKARGKLGVKDDHAGPA